MKAKNAGEETKSQIQKQVDQLQSMYDSACSKLVELKYASEESWDALKGGVESAAQTLKTAFQSAIAKFQ